MLGCPERGKENQSFRRKHRLANRIELPLERESPSMILERDGHWTIQQAFLDPGGKPLRGHEVGETVVPRSAIPVDRVPVDVNVCDTPILESLKERLGTLARGQGLDGLGIEHGVVEDLMADVEHRRLADEQNSRV